MALHVPAASARFGLGIHILDTVLPVTINAIRDLLFFMSCLNPLGESTSGRPGLSFFACSVGCAFSAVLRQVAGYAAVAHTVVVALLLCPRVLSSLCWGVSLAVDGWSPCAPHSAMDDSRALSGTPGDGCYSTESDNQVYWNEDWEEPIDSDKRGTSITVEW